MRKQEERERKGEEKGKKREREEKEIKDEKEEERQGRRQGGKEERKGRKANVSLFHGSVCLLIFDFRIHSIFLSDHVLLKNLYNFPKVKTSS